tara:strand:+ start:120 stop:875 length:756 start_codon:yes stop_codon:yes gene_type:complete
MATVNLGRIKPVFRGAYDNSTAYVIDDIVTSGNETFIAIAATQGNATSDASKWTKLAAKGADGTDVAATLANKEISFKTNAGALDGIPIGNAGEFLKVNSGATGYEFASAGGTNTPMFYVSKSGNQSISNSTETTVTFDTEQIDTDNAFASNTFTVPSGKGGKYFLFAQVRTDTAADFEAVLFGFKVNGTKVCASWWRNLYYNFGNISNLRNLSAGDTVTVFYKQDSGSSQNVGANDSGNVTFFGGYKLIE